MSPTRVLCLDMGLQCTGWTMADIVDDGNIRWMDMGVEVTSATTTQRWAPLLERLLPRLTEGIAARKDIKVYYERLVFNNFALMHIHRHLRQFFETACLTVRTLTPSQKWGVAGNQKRKDRKVASVEAARRVLTGSEWLERLEREERKHDLADAVLMVKYLAVKGG